MRLKFSGSPGKRRTGTGSEYNPADAAILNMTVDSQSLFRRRAQDLSPSRENGTADDVFPALISEANRELANLLRDLRSEPPAIVGGETRNGQVSELLMRAVRCAAKQYMLQAELGSLALTDELTGLYNRRGFMALAERQLKLGRRSGRGLLLFVMDVDRLKDINDLFGHYAGDCVLRRTAGVLEETFRDSDVVARLGGDEFAVLAIEAAGHSEASIRARFFERLKSVSADQSRCEISVSLGLARFDPCRHASIEELMMKADKAMYEQKRHRSRSRFETETNS
jgi:diguanylate cyclase (GGDEF)-like protein